MSDHVLFDSFNELGNRDTLRGSQICKHTSGFINFNTLCYFKKIKNTS